jgi:hypothetical protein
VCPAQKPHRWPRFVAESAIAPRWRDVALNVLLGVIKSQDAFTPNHPSPRHRQPVYGTLHALRAQDGLLTAAEIEKPSGLKEHKND